MSDSAPCAARGYGRLHRFAPARFQYQQRLRPQPLVQGRRGAGFPGIGPYIQAHFHRPVGPPRVYRASRLRGQSRRRRTGGDLGEQQVPLQPAVPGVRSLDIREDRITLYPCSIGGDFGGKGSFMDVPLCYYLALHSKRPVKMVMDYIQELMAGNPRHPATITLKTGLKKDGRLWARQANVVFNSGAYGAFKPRVNLGGADHLGGPYKIPHVSIDSYMVYSNNVPCGHMRAQAKPQVHFAVESHTDMIAGEIKMDPVPVSPAQHPQGRRCYAHRGDMARTSAPRKPWRGRGASRWLGQPEARSLRREGPGHLRPTSRQRPVRRHGGHGRLRQSRPANVLVGHGHRGPYHTPVRW